MMTQGRDRDRENFLSLPSSSFLSSLLLLFRRKVLSRWPLSVFSAGLTLFCPGADRLTWSTVRRGNDEREGLGHQRPQRQAHKGSPLSLSCANNLCGNHSFSSCTDCLKHLYLPRITYLTTGYLSMSARCTWDNCCYGLKRNNCLLICLIEESVSCWLRGLLI